MSDIKRDERIWASLLDLTARVETLEHHAGARQLAEGCRKKSVAADPDAWQKILQTAGGAGAVAATLANHLRGLFEPRGPRDLHVADALEGTSATKMIEVLEACSARLREFTPVAAGEVDLAPLGVRPFRRESSASRLGCTLSCSFCAKAQNEVAKLIAGPCVYICNECVDLSVSIISEG